MKFVKPLTKYVNSAIFLSSKGEVMNRLYGSLVAVFVILVLVIGYGVNLYFGLSLQMITIQGHYWRAEEILSANPDQANKVDNDGFTALDYAIMVNDEKMVEIFLRHNAKVTAKNGRGHSALEIAIAFCRYHCEKYGQANCPYRAIVDILARAADDIKMTGFRTKT
ncbi:ankyrin repeat domain-containing protein [bacterium]|nr:MAG: ankyrin repeat domain-containing protein [bacterium]